MRKQLNFGNISKVKNIIHIADIHIRLLNRHNEYKEVFNELYKEISLTNKNTIVFIGGDIVHNKIDITNEMLDLVFEFLNNIVNLRPVVLIKGNHDLNVNNQTRKSILDVVVPMINNPQLNYIDDSENVYYHNNLDFILYPFINNNLPNINELNENNIKIGMFHGCVNGSKTDSGMTLESDTNIKRFKDVDILLLGDIHKFQILSNQNPIALYPGSLIQQDFGESLYKHGYVIWDLESLSFKHFEINNNYGFYNLYMDYNVWKDVCLKLVLDSSNHISTLDSIKKDYVSLKVKYTESQEVLINEFKRNIIATLKDKHIKLNEVSFENISETKISEIKNKVDIHSIKSQLKLLEDYFKINKLNFNGIEDIHNEMLKTINYNRKQTNVWKPIELKFSNLFSYGNDNHINFKNMNGSFGLFAPNTHGKSSIMEIISFVCFNKTSKTNSINKIMNISYDSFNVEFTFENNNNYYKIVRNGERKKDDKVKMTFNFYRVNDIGEIIEDLTDGKNESYNLIKSYIGTYDDFVLTTLSLQNNNSNFIDKTQSQRKELIQQFLELDIFEKLHSVSNQKVNEYKTILKTLETKYNTINVNYDELIQKSLIEKQTKELELNVINSSINDVEIKIKNLNLNIKDVGSFNLNKINTAKDFLNNEITKSKQLITNNVFKINELNNNKKNNIIKLILGIDYDLIKINFKDYENNVNLINKLENEIKQINNKLKLHSNLKFNESCECCDSNKLHFNIIEDENKIIKLENEIKELKLINVNISKSFMGYNYEVFNSIVETNKQIESDIKDIENEITKLELQIKTVELEYNNNTHKLEEVNNELLKYNESIILFENNNKLLNEISILEDDLSNLKNKKQPIDTSIITLNNNIVRYETKQEELNNLKVDINNTKEIFTKYNLYNNAVSKNGIVLSLFKEVIPILEKEANVILNNVCKFNVKFELDGNDIDCYIDYGYNKKWDVSTISGMERFITSLAIRIALINISQLPRSNFMVIDEGFGVLDKENMNELRILFSYFKNIFDFYIIISHIELLRDFVDNTLNIERFDDIYSKIIYK
jgi:DNA repair exonuclease SbcCD ATPase subunit/DNA repair exonuclease SbcCD nuclease subunit